MIITLLHFAFLSAYVDPTKCEAFSGDITRQQIEFSGDSDHRFDFGRDCRDVV